MLFACLKRRRPVKPLHRPLVQTHETHTQTCDATQQTLKLPTSQKQQDGWAVFWDFENMALWKRYNSIADIVQHVNTCLFAISKTNSVKPRVTRFYGIGKISRIPPKVLKRLEQHGIKTMNSPSRHKNAADIVIVTEIMKCLIEAPPQGVCLITNDGDFSHCMKTVDQLGYTTALLHDNPSKALTQTVRNSIDLSTTYVRKPIAYTEKHEASSRAKLVKEPVPAYLPKETGKRPGLTHLLRILEMAGGGLYYSELQRQLGQLPEGWLSNLIESGTLQRRLRLHGSWVMLLSWQTGYYSHPQHFYQHQHHNQHHNQHNNQHNNQRYNQPLYLHQLGKARA